MMIKKLKNRPSQRWIIASTLIALTLMAVPVQAGDQESIQALRRIGKAFASIAEKASPAVVGIEAEKVYTGRSKQEQYHHRMPFDEDVFEWFFGPRGRGRMPQREREQPRRRHSSQGTGFLVSHDGYILTNNHLVGTEEGMEVKKVTVKLADGSEFDAEVIGTDPDTDVAVVKIKGDDHDYLELADSDAAEVGEWVVAIGNPFGFAHTVTSGIVSAKGRNVNLTSYDDFIQTDAAINPGNSGGPLLNLDGKVIGINSAIYGPMGNIGIGLAIPINMAQNVYEQLIASGEVARGFLGVQIDDVTHSIARQLDLDEAWGSIIVDVTEDSAAEKAGMRANDVVITFEGEKVKNAQDFRHKVARVKPGEKVEMVVVRKGKERTLRATLDRKTSDEVASSGKKSNETKLGIEIHNLTDSLAERYGYEDMEGVLIVGVEPGSDAERKRLQPGMLILEANFEPVKNTRQLNDILEEAKEDGEVTLRVYTGRMKSLVTIKFVD